MKNLEYQQRAVTELIDKTIRLLNAGGQRNKMVFEATTGAGKTVMACLMLAGLMDELQQETEFGFWERLDDTHTVIRFATSWATNKPDTDALCAILRKHQTQHTN